jgi:two-component system, NtrC family, sensor kinase
MIANRKKSSGGEFAEVEGLDSFERFSSTLAHKMNNPLGLVLGYTQLILKDLQPGDRFYEDLKTVEKHARNCKKILEGTLELFRSGRITKGPADLDALIIETLLPVRRRLEAMGVSVCNKACPEPVNLYVDVAKIKQAITHILVNCAQAMEGGGRLTVAAEYDKSGDRAVVSFRDTGCGIPPRIMGKIFEPFFTTRPDAEAAGLGLAVAQEIIRAHGGEIRVKSIHGKGSLFTVLLPPGSHGSSKAPPAPLSAGK